MQWRLDPGQIEVVDEDVAAVLRSKSAAERIALATSTHDLARQMMVAQVRRMYPGHSDEQVRHEVARRLIRDAD